ncbi:hypothetical protein CC1G_03511 [Coprinopsis cinerea okayama7|uniref:Tim44-like domain-containing protein n=1 Tax=Coprinopsis cinerea (strain Okayama-7 / 130 / ATCC MYA-4618 / FGSC 9003) TaxID=240176 RepID=A8NCF3_COPC7|nr:hypothetical protein CC1G_03511 [Coprinopsis cinerea okayama7\|eukprot:XP_001832497.2 hypothetical protein CC1G_03511 [Coprinopsis cinerea okayama7\
MSAYRAYALGLRCSGYTPIGLPPCQATRYLSSRRTYATESALASKTKGAPSAKATHRATSVSSASPKRTPAKVEGRAAGHQGQNQAAAEVKTLPQRSTSKAGHTHASASTVQETASKPPTKPAEKTLEEKQLEELEALQYFGQVMKSSDPYGQPIPQSLGQFWKNRLNDAKSAMSLLYLAADNVIPGVHLGRTPWYKYFGWLWKAFKVKSTKDNTWLAPFRRIALETYVELNTSLANRDSKTLRALTTSEYQSEILRRLKKQPHGLHFKWNLEREVSPTQVLSLRVVQYYMAKEEPKFGSRYLVHALVKFDTEQSLEIYGPRGEALHEVAEGAVKRPNGTIAAKPKRVTEYLILEKRLWYDTPWIFREQMWETKN